MSMKKTIGGLTAFGVAGILALSACSSGAKPSGSESGSEGESGAAGATASGEITFLTNRTDLQTDGTWDTYIAEFNKEYPDVKVNVEGITNYEDDVRTRMASPDGYGDVLMLPAGISPSEYPNYFSSLGKTEELSETYRFLSKSAYQGDQYGIYLGGTANGVLYNTEVFEKAGVAELPKTPEEFNSALQAVKDKTEAAPLYTNYADGWPLGGQWTNLIGAISGNPEAQNEMAKDPAPWTEGNDIYVIDSVLFDAVANGLTEADPLTTNWEQSKGDFANGKIATMVLGSWAISQFQAAAEDAGVSPDSVGFMAFPSTASDGKQYATVAGDYALAVNKNSDKQDAAKAWLYWLVDESGFTEAQGMISSVLKDPLPSNLSTLTENGVELLEMAAAPEGQESLFSDVADKSQVDVWGNIYRQKLVDVARGQQAGDKAAYFGELNDAWGKAVAELAG